MKRWLIGTALLSLTAPALAGERDVSYPEGYRDWHHVKSMVIQEGHPLFAAFGGIHHIYANKTALEGYRSGKFPDGAVIVFDLFDAQSVDHAIVEGTRKVVGVMHKDARRYAATGGWGFEGFGGGDRNQRAVGDKAATACFACHAPQKDHDYVYSALRK
ncbi:cytochrome P460 family protein [Rudaea sp.]|uniref:cytochrome P460 family protein n=1 Tax=Rudaea sp. TaxID=2136325 RepID=UPI003783D266